MNINNTTTMNNNVSNLKKFQKLNCSPKPHNQNLEFSCFTSTMLYELQEKWNIRHPDKRINFDDPYSIWGYFKTTFGEICENEVCWLQQEFAKSSLGKTFLHSFPYNLSFLYVQILGCLRILKMRLYQQKHRTKLLHKHHVF